MKIALLVAYDGSGFRGFARQRSQRTVQGQLEEKLSLLLRREITTTGAGRTDAGVHAAAQVVSFDAPAGTDPAWLAQRLNKMLAPELVVRAAAEVSDDFDARFSARRRTYQYRIYRSVVADPFLDRFALHVPGILSLKAMREGAKALLGEHDFSAFCRRGEGSMVRRIRSIRLSPSDKNLTVTIEADSFCHQMVRSMVGLLVDVGLGKRPPSDVGKALRARDRGAAGPVADARGLHLVGVSYRKDPFRTA